MELILFKDMVAELFGHHLFQKTMLACLATVVIWLLARLIKTAVSSRIEDKDIRYKLRKVIDLLSYLITLVVVMTIFSEQMTNLAVIIGALSVGIGFALREVIQSLIGWIAITMWGMFRIGERIKIGQVMGDIIDISPLTTTVMECGDWVQSDQYNGRIVRLSNSLVLRENVFNYSSNFDFLWDEIDIPVRTDSDHRKARMLIEQVARSELEHIRVKSLKAWNRFAHHHMVEEQSFEPNVTMRFDENWITFTLRYVVDYRQRRSIKDKLFTNTLNAFEHTQGRVQVASNFMRAEINRPDLRGDGDREDV